VNICLNCINQFAFTLDMQHANSEVETEFVNIIDIKFVLQKKNIKTCFMESGCRNVKNWIYWYIIGYKSELSS
jgi:hypothetical protein